MKPGWKVARFFPADGSEPAGSPSYRFVGQDERIMSMQQLAGWVRDRRAQLELTQEESPHWGRCRTRRCARWESGRAGLRRHTRTALERALQWQTGGVQDAIEHGLRPQPIAEKARPSKRRTWCPHVTTLMLGRRSPPRPRWKKRCRPPAPLRRQRTMRRRPARRPQRRLGRLSTRCSSAGRPRRGQLRGGPRSAETP